MISVSMLPAYLYCKRKLFIEQVLGIREEPKEETVKGRIRHKIFEEMALREQNIILAVTDKHNVEDVAKLYSSAFGEILRNTLICFKYALKSVNLRALDLFKEIWPMLLEESKAKAGILIGLIREYGVYGHELLTKLPKAEPEHRIESKTLNLVGVIDRIEFIDNRPVPIEFKTGKMPLDGVWPGHKIQIAAYCLLIEEKFGSRVAEGYVHYLDYAQKRRISLNPFLRNEVIEMIGRVRTLLESKHPPELPENANKCVSCGLRQICHNEEELNKALQKTLNTT